MSPDDHDHFPNGLQALLLVLALFVAELFFGALLHDAQDLLQLSPGALGALDVLLANALVFTAVMHIKRMTYAELFHASGASRRATLLLLLPPILLLIPSLVLVVSALVDALAEVMPLSNSEQAMFSSMAAHTLPSVVVTCVLAPVVEEMLFRGVVLRGFLQRYARWEAILLSAILFGFAHLNLYQFVAAFILGVFAGWLYERSRSLIPCIGLHAAYNSALVVLEWTQSPSSGSSADGSSPLVNWLLALAAAAIGAQMLRRTLLGRRA